MPRQLVEREVVVAIADNRKLPRHKLLARVLARGAFWERVADGARRAAVDKENLRIVIKPDLGGFQLGSPAATDPALVESLIDLLHDRGYTNVAIAAASDSSSLWADNREVMALADLLGYRYETRKGRSYEVLDLADDLEQWPWPEGSSLDGSALSRTWTTADVRIVVAKNRTDEADGYALGLDNLIGILPLSDKDYYYRRRLDPGTVVVDILKTAPPHFVVIDALVSAHGNGGSRAPRALATRTLIASSDAVLADYAASLKMGVDPYTSRVVAPALRGGYLPATYRIDGSLQMYDGWRPVHPLLTDSTRQREEWVGVNRSVKPWLQLTDGEMFPFKNPVDARANAMLAGRLANVDENVTMLSILLLANYSASWAYRALSAYRVMYDKDSIRRREVALGIDPAAFEAAKYRAALPELEALRQLLRDTEADANALRWRYIGEAVVFEITRDFPVPFDEFVQSVDVARTIQFMNDYIGGVVVPVDRDGEGRVTRQAERNLYLAQPNYMVLYEADLIDVTKLEYVEYTDKMHRMCWKTIKSENNSAIYDDGIVTFAKNGNATRVSIFGRQLFTLPPLFKVVNPDLNPTLKNHLVAHAYTTFFNRTFSNFEALLEGRDIRIGVAWHDASHSSDTEPLLTDTLGKRLLDLVQKYGPLIENGLHGNSESAPMSVDKNGFAHFRPMTDGASPAHRVATEPSAVNLSMDEWRQFWSELVEAVERDVEWQARHGMKLP